MKLGTVAVAAVVLASGAAVAQPNAPARRGDAVINVDGFGPVRIGMTLQEARRALGPGWTLEDPIEPGDVNGCRHLVRDGAPVIYMLNGGRVTRASLSQAERSTASRVRTPRGIGLGSTEGEVRRAYGRALEDEPHAYVGLPGRYLTIWVVRPRAGRTNGEDPQARGIRFETDENRRVTQIHAGDSTIRYIEGCA